MGLASNPNKQSLNGYNVQPRYKQKFLNELTNLPFQNYSFLTYKKTFSKSISTKFLVRKSKQKKILEREREK